MTEAETKSLAQAERMKEWFQGRDIPKGLHIGRYMRFVDTERYVRAATATLDHSAVNSNSWRAAYYRLWRLKKELEK